MTLTILNNSSDVVTLRNLRERNALINSWLESDKIGQLIRNGRTIYYAILDGITFEGASRFIVACKLYAHSVR
jgi:hypothetical protein